MTPEKGVGPILPKVAFTESFSELLDVFGGEEGPPVGIAVDSLE